MERTHSHRDADGRPPVVGAPSSADGHGSDKGRHLYLRPENFADDGLWPIADVVGRPLINPHRLAQTTRDRDAAYNRLRANHRWDSIAAQIERDRRTSDRLYQWVIVSGSVFMFAVLLWMAIDQYLDAVLP